MTGHKAIFENLKRSGNPNRKAFNEALGGFLHDFAVLERNVFEALEKATAVSHNIGSIIFSGVRLAAAISHLRKIAEADNWPKGRRDAVVAWTAQLEKIIKLRNDLLHYGTSSGDKEGTMSWTISNRKLIYDTKYLKEQEVSTSIINDAAADLMLINLHVVRIILRYEPTDQLPVAFWSLLDQMPFAWLYKPQQRTHAETR